MIYKKALMDSVISTISHCLEEGKIDPINMVKLASNKRISIEPNSEKAKIIEAEVSKHPNALFFIAKAIEANVANSNGDYFSEEELLKSYKTFEGVPFFTNHDNQNIENARGKIVFAEWNPKDKAVYTIQFVDRDAYPHICRSIEEEYVTGCFPPDAPVLMFDGVEKQIIDVDIGDSVISGNGNTRKVIGKRYKGYAYPILSMTVEGLSQPLVCTAYHNIVVYRSPDICACGCGTKLVPQKDKRKTSQNFSRIFAQGHNTRGLKYNHEYIKKIPASELKIGDLLIEPKINNETKNSVTEDEAFLIGLFLAEGSFEKRDGIRHSVIFNFGATELETIAKKCKDLLDKVFLNYRNVATVNYYPDSSQTRICLYGKEMADWFYNKCGEYSEGKKLSKDLLCLDEDTTASLLAGYMEGDGCAVSKKYFSVTTVSPILASQIRLLFSKIGIRTNYRIRKNPGNLDGNFLYLPCHEINFGTTTSTKLSEKLIFKGVKESPHKAAKWHSFDEYTLRPIRDIKEINYNGTVYDLEIEEDHTYCVNHLAVSNTSMGCSVSYSECNICGNLAEKTDEYCDHIKNRKGRKFSGKARNVKTGEVKDFRDQLVFEYNYGLKFIELSAVVDPACPSCHIQGIIPNADYLKRVANIENSLQMIKTSALEKKASKEEIEQIEGVLETLEGIAVNLIKNRKQVEMEFASDLVDILSNLQTWLDELVGAGYGNLQGGVPGSEEAPAAPTTEEPAQVPNQPAPTELPPSAGSGVAGAVPAAAATPVGQPSAITGAPGKAPVQSPKLPIATPKRPKTSEIGSSMSIQRIADEVFDKGSQVLMKAANLNDKMTKMGEINMAKRRTLAEKKDQTDKTKEVLSNLWQEKQEFFEYIKEVPSLQDNEHKLSVMKRDDTFIIVAEEKSQSMSDGNKMIWTYENLTDGQKQLIKASPKEAAVKLLDTFAKNLKQQKEGVKRMTDINKNAGATSVNKAPEVITEKQLEQKGLYHSRTGDEADQITQAQLESLRKGEQDVVTEKQLNSGMKLNPRTSTEAEVITEKQLDSVREDNESDVVTQKQLDGNRVNNEADVVTEKQLNDTATPWARSAKRNPSTFKTAIEHLDGAIDVMADSAISSGCTPDEICSVAASLVDTTKNRYSLATSILESEKIGEKVDFAKRAAFWNNQNLKVASAGTKEIAKLIVDGLRKVASDLTINPEVLISAVDVIAEGGDAITSIAEKIQAKMASASTTSKVKNIKAELREALKKTPVSTKEDRDAERKEILASVDSKDSKMNRASERKVWENILNKKAVKETASDLVIETNFSELGCKREDPAFKKAIVGFTKGALASQNIKVATITNVTISGDTIQIAVQSDEGNESVEIPVGDQSMPSPEETMPEGDLSGEGLEDTMGAAPAPAPTAMAKASKKMTKVAQTPPGGAMGGQPGGVAAPGDPSQGLPGGTPGGDPVQALTTGDEDVAEDVPTVGEQQMPWTICPECGKSDVDVTNEEGDIKGKCNNPECGAEYDAMIKKNIEFKITKPSKLQSGEGTAESPDLPEAAPEVPAMPVAAQTRIDKNSIVRIGKNKKQFGHVCPACGKTACKATKDEQGHSEFTCEACGTGVQKDILLSASNPEVGFLRVKWDIVPKLDKGCKDCTEKVAKFASRIKVEKLLITAAEKAGDFPMSNCIERIARTYGGNTVGSFGPCKGKLLAECACKELQKLGFTKVRHLQKFAEASMTKDPMDECVKEQSKKGHSIKEASSICNCLKKKFASEVSDNIYAQAFGEDVVEGRETLVTARDLKSIYEIQKEATDATIKEAAIAESEAEIGDDLPALREATIEVEIVKEAAKEVKAEKSEKADKAEKAEKAENCDKCKKVIKDCVCPKKEKVEAGADKENKEMKEAKSELSNALQMNGQRVRKVAEEVVKVAGQPKFVEHIEDNVEAGVPRQEQYLGKEKEADSAINKTPAKPNIPRGDAYMGKEKDADSAINKALNLPDVAVDHGFIGDEARIQSGMPAINNEIKGTVIAKDEKVTKEAKQMKEVEDVQGNVDVPKAPNGGKLGKEKDADSAINTPNKGPDVPSGEAYMGEESKADSLINKKLKGPDVPIDSSYMGDEKNVQKGMPAINDEILKNVQQQRSEQLNKISRARELKANSVASWLVANKRVGNDMDTFNAVVKALSAFEIDHIPAVADKMFPERSVKTASTVANKTEASGHTIPAIILESKTESDGDSLQKRLSSAFTIGNTRFDNSLTMYGEKQ